MILSVGELLVAPKINGLLLINAKDGYLPLATYLAKHIKSLKCPQGNTNSNAAYNDIIKNIDTQDMFSEEFYYEINHSTAPPKADAESIVQLSQAKNLTLVITTNNLKPQDLKTKWATAINNYGTICTIGPNDIAVVIMHMLQPITITQDALRLLIELNHSNPSQLMQVAQQLGLSYPAGRTITLNDIKALNINNRMYNIYNLSDAYLNGSFPLAVEIINNLLQNTEDEILIGWVIAEDVKKLIKLKAQLKQKIDLGTAMNNIGIWRTHASMFKNAHARLSYNHLLKVIELLSILDQTAKGLLKHNTNLLLTQILQVLCKPL